MWMLLLPECFDDGHFIGVRALEVYLSFWSSWPPSRASLSACSFPLIPQCAGIHYSVRCVWSARSARAVFISDRSFWRGFWNLLRKEIIIFEDDHIGLGSG